MPSDVRVGSRVVIVLPRHTGAPRKPTILSAASFELQQIVSWRTVSTAYASKWPSCPSEFRPISLRGTMWPATERLRSDRVKTQIVAMSDRQWGRFFHEGSSNRALQSMTFYKVAYLVIRPSEFW